MSKTRNKSEMKNHSLNLMYLRQNNRGTTSLFLIPIEILHPFGKWSPKPAASTTFFFILGLPHCPSSPVRKPSSPSTVASPSVRRLISSPNGSTFSPNATKSTVTPFAFKTSRSLSRNCGGGG